MKYAIDGSNVLHGLRLNRKPSTRLFSKLLLDLKKRGNEFQLFFDDSIERQMKDEGLSTDWWQFKDALNKEGITAIFVPHADPHIQEYCKAYNAALLNSTDKINSWNIRPNIIHSARTKYLKGDVRIRLYNSADGDIVFICLAHESFAFGGIEFPNLGNISPVREFITNEPSVGNMSEGTLLVLALDASQSMTNEAFDGFPKSHHVNEIVKSTISTLRRSAIADGLYLAILRFENNVTYKKCPKKDTIFSSIYDWDETTKDFDYLSGIRPGQTNIRLALQRSKELFQDTLTEDDSISNLADYWRAIIVLITDGNHYIQRPDGTDETDADVAHEVVEIHSGVAAMTDVLIENRIMIGCVGIGTDINRKMLEGIASQRTAIQRQMAQSYNIDHLFEGEKLFINVDPKKSGFDKAIRAFIDLASS